MAVADRTILASRPAAHQREFGRPVGTGIVDRAMTGMLASTFVEERRGYLNGTVDRWSQFRTPFWVVLIPIVAMLLWVLPNWHPDARSSWMSVRLTIPPTAPSSVPKTVHIRVAGESPEACGPRSFGPFLCGELEPVRARVVFSWPFEGRSVTFRVDRPIDVRLAPGPWLVSVEPVNPWWRCPSNGIFFRPDKYDAEIVLACH
jgi:hypothetical protein